MSFAAAFAVPHPPLAVAGIGRGQEEGIANTLRSYREVARRIVDIRPDVIIIVSPHATAYYDYVHISPGAGARGDFSAFGDPGDQVETDYDERLVSVISEEASKAGIPAGTMGERDSSLDHGTMVPLTFIQAAGANVPIVRMGISGLSGLEHYRLGQCIARAVDRLGRRAVFIASGDLSHKLKQDGPYGFDAQGPEFDRAICKIFATADFGELLTLDNEMCERSAECGLRTFQVMAGALDGLMVRSELLSYEGPYGVGYAVGSFSPLWASGQRHFGDMVEEQERTRFVSRRTSEDAYARLARLSLESWVREGRPLDMPEDLPAELCDRRAGAFVSLKKDGELRGCIGTLEPTRANLAEEIVNNAVSAGTRDPRFPAVTAIELDHLVYSVDVLSEPELVRDLSTLDAKRYGVIVSTPDGRRGVLLPNLDGVDTPAQQISIARRKGGIDPTERITLQRFEVVRHR